MADGTLYAVGIGPGDPQLLTLKAVSVLRRCPVIAAPRTAGERTLALDIAAGAVDLSDKQVMFLDFPMSRDRLQTKTNHQLLAKRLAERLTEGSDVALLCLGDASLYSSASYLVRLISAQGLVCQVVAGVPSFCAAAAALCQSLTAQDQPLVVIPAACAELDAALALPGSKVLMKPARRLPELRRKLRSLGLAERTSLVANCGLPDQRIYRELDETSDQEGYFTTLLVRPEELKDDAALSDESMGSADTARTAAKPGKYTATAGAEQPRRLVDGRLLRCGVTTPGLDQPVGAAVINTVPRRMIRQEVESVCTDIGYDGGLSVEISIPGGAALAERTFNPQLGIVGGLSILGTTGIVEPMSVEALIETIRRDIAVRTAAGLDGVVLTPGAYGQKFIQQQLDLPEERVVLCSNFLGDALAAAVEAGLRQVLLVGHIGKLIKLGIGAFNTHSNQGDGRAEIMAACALEAGAALPVLRSVLRAATTDAMLDILRQHDLEGATLGRLAARVEERLSRCLPADYQIGWICFTQAGEQPRILWQNETAVRLTALWRQAKT